ncbi:CEI_1a_G0039670.mRNA.1.CDS.1 [Saccharomyces cerevisiae]|nr:EM14S01-3B_G0021810.mRNA.1.CDS.1 [Saccharomyces cerevisiae]CAI4617727.1 AMH_1a_G0039770.mRNA.1.CDS.1 [Saccharomyces cerevisiae]CAI4620082.1 CEI_1a_G0039670.mRNA.1.CDS.1 [Saccharomyces cerevisiae]CAI6787055.1 AMH_1a_G0039770.mRNA.1.CDS.1 [Saccharomyces cerevisiae]CAI7398498.1 CEI_1a_G0039670.mRNA.1.CDS.1 [Saccharomyces cerevisiae]
MIPFPVQHEIFHAYIGRITPHSSRCIANMWHSAHFFHENSLSIMKTLVPWTL